MLTGRAVAVAIIVAGLVLPLRHGPLPTADFDYGDQPREPVLEGFNETSSGLASGAATPDGRPLLWKNRDRGGTSASEFHYYSDGRIPFIAFTDNNSTTTYYGGLNAEGFALENTDAHNIPHGPHNDGTVILDALALCRTVDDFAVLLDSADRRDANGRYGYNYGVIDAYGGAAIYEARQFDHTRYDAADSPDGFLIRSNYAYTGSSPNESPATYGLHRHNRAMALFKAARDRGELTAQFIFSHVSRDLTTENLDPYPLPFRGYYSDYPYGCIDNSTAICRSTTTAAMVAQGVRAGERPDDAVLWSMNGSPVTGIMTPLWVRAGSAPREYDGPDSSRINARIIRLYEWVYSTFAGTVDTWKLTNPQGTGLWDFLLPLEDLVFRKTDRFLRSPQFSYDRLAGFQNELAQQVADSLYSWKPTYKINEVTGLIFWNGNVDLLWGEPDGGGLGRGAANGYNVYRAPEPFRDGMPGELIGRVEEREFVDEEPLPGGGFYRVEAVF